MNHPRRAPAPLRLTALEHALAEWLALLAPVAARAVQPARAVGRVLAGDLRAPAPVPATSVALRDGWAVTAADTLGAGPYAPVPLPVPPLRLRPGGALPPGTDAVLPGFDLDADGPFAQVLQPVAAGDGVRRPGEEIPADTLLRATGERLRPQDMPALVALGLREIAVRVPRLAWMATGDDIAADPARDTNGAVLAALAAAEGAEWTTLPPVPAMPAAIAAALRAAAPAHDLILLGGGTGEGPEDRSAEALAAAGRLLRHGIGARSGTTAGFGVAVGTPVLLVPGRTEDALAAWLLLARPAIAALSGRAAAPAPRARLARKVASFVGMAELVPLRRDDAGRADPLAVGALPLWAVAAADAVLVVSPRSEGYEADTEIPILPL